MGPPCSRLSLPKLVVVEYEALEDLSKVCTCALYLHAYYISARALLGPDFNRS